MVYFNRIRFDFLRFVSGDCCALYSETPDRMADKVKIVYQDDCLVVVWKPSGLLVHRSLIDKHETEFALQIVRDMIGKRVYPLHRLDKPTSGLLLFALSSEMATEFGEQFSSNNVEKEYLAVVRGFFPNSVTVDYPLKEKLDKKSDKQARTDKAPQTAVTDFSCLHQVTLPYAVGRYDTARYSLVKARPNTGRKHQIRRHLAHLRHPIIGDVNYGDNKHNHFYLQSMDFHGLALVANKIKIFHPVKQQFLLLTGKMEPRFEDLFIRWGLSAAAAQELWSK